MENSSEFIKDSVEETFISPPLSVKSLDSRKMTMGPVMMLILGPIVLNRKFYGMEKKKNANKKKNECTVFSLIANIMQYNEVGSFLGYEMSGCEQNLEDFLNKMGENVINK